jgi:hypothetical protein
MNQYPVKNHQPGKDMLSHEVSLSQKNESSIRNQEESSLKKLSQHNQQSLHLPAPTGSQMPEGMYRTQQASTQQNRLSKISTNGRADTRDGAHHVKQASLAQENLKPGKQ